MFVLTIRLPANTKFSDVIRETTGQTAIRFWLAVCGATMLSRLSKAAGNNHRSKPRLSLLRHWDQRRSMKFNFLIRATELLSIRARVAILTAKLTRQFPDFSR